MSKKKELARDYAPTPIQQCDFYINTIDASGADNSLVERFTSELRNISEEILRVENLISELETVREGSEDVKIHHAQVGMMLKALRDLRALRDRPLKLLKEFRDIMRDDIERGKSRTLEHPGQSSGPVDIDID